MAKYFLKFEKVDFSPNLVTLAVRHFFWIMLVNGGYKNKEIFRYRIWRQNTSFLKRFFHGDSMFPKTKECLNVSASFWLKIVFHGEWDLNPFCTYSNIGVMPMWENPQQKGRISVRLVSSGQYYKHFTLVNYDSKVVIWGIFQSGTTLES